VQIIETAMAKDAIGIFIFGLFSYQLCFVFPKSQENQAACALFSPGHT
jgi:hypothetical protein